MRSLLLATLALSSTLALTAFAQQPIFPGAEGFGGVMPAGGFTNAQVYRVTKLTDPTDLNSPDAVGTLRHGLRESGFPAGGRIIVFDVGGTIQLNNSLDIKNLPRVYIAGQTAPSPITIYGNTTQITSSGGKTNQNVAVRYLSFRKGTGDGEDSITFSGSGLGSNLILDHVSASWAEDEILSVTNNNTNATVQYSIIHDALVNNHAYGSLIRPKIDSNVTFHHNLYAHNASRQARFGTYDEMLLTADFRNNVIYNWRDRASYAGGSSDAEREYADVNYVGNYLIAGPGTGSNTTRAFDVDQNIDARVYQSGNFIDSDKQGGFLNGADTGWNMFRVSAPPGGAPERVGTLTQMGAPFATPAVTTQPAAQAYHQVINYVGNSWWNRDAIDARVIGNVQGNTGPPLAAAAPLAGELSGLLAGPMTTRPAGFDSDNDGMPNAWELAHGLNPDSTTLAPDWKLDFDGDSYTNLEEYLNELGAFPAPAPIVFNGATNSRYAQITNWKTDDGGVTVGTHWQPSRFDTAVLRNGTATVDAVGQHARFLRMASSAGDVATLAVTAGWLDVASEVEYGWGGAGTIEHTGGTLLTPILRIGPAGVYNLSASGVLRARHILLNEGGQFNFTGGVLDAEEILFHLVNQGGVISPGVGVGGTNFFDLTIESGSLLMELGGATPDAYDFVGVESLIAGGTLDVNLINGYSPQLGDSFQLFYFETASGAFTFDLPSLAEGLVWNTDELLITGVLSVASTAGNPADFNGDGMVDGDDLDEWRQGFGATGQVDNGTGDANGDGAVDGSDFLVWQQLTTSAVAAGAGQTPEPTAAIMLAIGVAAWFAGPKKRQPRQTRFTA